MKRLFAVCLGVSLLARVGSAVVIPVKCNLFFNGSNAVQIAWNCYPGKSYVIQTTTNLAQPWQNAPTTPPTLSTTTNWLSYSFPVAAKAQFFKVVKLDTDGPEVYKTAPFDGAIGVDPQATIQAWLRDDTGVNTNTIALTVGTNAPVSLSDSRLSYISGVLTYTPGTNQFLGTNGQIVTATLSVTDTLGNQTTNFTWSFQLELAPVFSSNIVVLGSAAPKGPAPNGPFPKDANSCNLTLVSTNGDYFTLTYSGSCCLTNGMVLMNADPYAGYTRTVVDFTNYPASNTVVALTRPTLLAEALQTGTLSSSSPVLLTNSIGGSVQPKDFSLTRDFPLQFTVPLVAVLHPDTDGFLLETTTGSQFVLNATLQLAGNVQGGRLSALQAEVTGSASLELDVHARAGATKTLSGNVSLFTPPPATYWLLAGGWWPVWVEVKFEVNLVYSANFEAAVDATAGVNIVKTITVGEKWSAAGGAQKIFDNPAVVLNFTTPAWQVQGTADVMATLQPKVTVLVYSAAGVETDLDPYLDLSGSVQANPYQWDLGLSAGMNANVGLDLSIWDKSWSPLGNLPLTLIPKQTLWQRSGGSLTPPQITPQPQSQSVSAGSAASFSVQAAGSLPLSYQWYKNGLYLTDDTRITGSAGSTLSIASVQSSDAGTYTVRVSNPAGSVTSAGATLTVSTGPGSMALIPVGSFTMGNCMDPGEGNSDELPLHTVYVSAFYTDKYLVTKSLWDTVYQWAIVHGYSFDYAGSGKAATHPVQTIDWYDCVKWCNARSEKEGKTPAYYTDAGLSVRYRSGQVAAYVSWSSGYRLPTEAEWEKAARGGASGQRFPWGYTISWGQANYYAYPSGYAYDVNPTQGYHPTFATGAYPYTSPVGYFAANGYGLYDMAGNVWQWCWDWYGSYSSGAQSDPRGPASGSYRVYRGGGWTSFADYCRTAFRSTYYPTYSKFDIGFRSVLPAGQ
jgi:formylglycine-generating enzyme required for sulfatase activity